jgi:hypothetical protein
MSRRGVAADLHFFQLEKRTRRTPPGRFAATLPFQGRDCTLGALFPLLGEGGSGADATLPDGVAPQADEGIRHNLLAPHT